jgi:DNA invertase Pin-like site-specific DNA recombinase
MTKKRKKPTAEQLSERTQAVRELFDRGRQIASESAGRQIDQSKPARMAMKYGYARVSTDDQNPALQLAALKSDGCETVFKDEGLSGATTNRPALLQCLKKLQSGDTLTVWKLDRLGRNLRDLITMLDDLKKRGIKFRSLTEHIDTETPTGRAMWQMIGVLAELERSRITERTRAGVKAAQRRGVKFGRKPKLSRQQIEHARKLIEAGEERQKVATLFKVGRKTLYRALAQT